MNESIYIKDIGPLRHIELDDIKPLTIIIGESASGKSTLMKILAQFRYFYKMAVISSWLKNANVKGTYFENEVSEYWKRAGLEEMLKPSSAVLYRVKVNGNSYELSYKNGILSAFPVIPNEDLQFFKISFISENRSVIPDWSKMVHPMPASVPNSDFISTKHSTILIRRPTCCKIFLWNIWLCVCR